MSDTRNHTTRDQLADLLINLRVPNPLAAGAENDIEMSGVYDWAELQRFADALLASDAIAAVRAAAVAETTAAIEALLQQVEDDARENRHLARLSTREVRAALSGGRTALDTLLAQAWDQGYWAVQANENPYRADTGADQ